VRPALLYRMATSVPDKKVVMSALYLFASVVFLAGAAMVVWARIGREGLSELEISVLYVVGTAVALLGLGMFIFFSQLAGVRLG